MKKINIAIKNKTKLTQKLEEVFEVQYHKKQSLLSKLTFKTKTYPDIYFHQGSLDKTNLELIENTPIIIVNSGGQKEQLINKLPNIEQKKIQVLYPYLNKTLTYDENIKNSFRKKYNLDENTKLIFFTSKDLNSSGLRYFLKIISNLQEKNFKVVVQGDKKQIEQLKLQLNRLKVNFQVILLEDDTSIEELFISSDIFILPTKQKNYVSNILRAMYYKNAVFLPSSNFASEIIDTFSIMQSVEDPSTSFKIDALLSNTNELEQIQNINSNMSDSFSFESRFEIIKSIIYNYLD